MRKISLMVSLPDACTQAIEQFFEFLKVPYRGSNTNYAADNKRNSG